MKHLFSISRFRLVAAAILAMAAPLSMAGGQPEVSWSISVGSPYPAPQVYAPPPVVYVTPQPVYVRPQPVYVRPQPVYVQPATVVQYGPPMYVEEGRHRKHKHWKHHRQHGHYDY